MYNIYKTFLFAMYEPLCTIFTFSQKTFSQKHIYKNIFCLQVFTKTIFTYKFVTKTCLLQNMFFRKANLQSKFTNTTIFL